MLKKTFLTVVMMVKKVRGSEEGNDNSITKCWTSQCIGARRFISYDCLDSAEIEIYLVSY